MKQLMTRISIFLFALLALPFVCSSQDSLSFDMEYSVQRIHPSFSISKDELNTARTLSDLNKHFPASWIKEYVSVEIVTSHKGKVRKALSKNGTLTYEQKENIKTADVTTIKK